MRAGGAGGELSGDSRGHLPAFGAHLKKKTEERNRELTGRGGEEGIRSREVEYRVDGEVGRFTFTTHEVVADEKVVFKSTDMFPPQQGTAYYLTRGFRELGMLLGATEASYRKVCKRLNRQRRQEEGGTPLNTLRDATEAEGKRVLDFFAVKTATVLEAQGVDENHPPSPELCETPERIVQESELSRAEVSKAFVEAEIPEALQDEVASNPVPYERPEESVKSFSERSLTCPTVSSSASSAPLFY